MARLPFTSSLCLLALLSTAGCPRSRGATPTPTPTAQPHVNLVFTASVRGWVEPCGCTTDPLGGIDRIRGELDRIRAEGPTLYFDAGGLLFDRMQIPPGAVCQEDARIKLLLGSGRAAGLALTSLGAFDLARGDAFRAQALGQHSLPAVSANATGAVAVQPRLMQEVGGIKVGFTGVTWPADTPLPTGETSVAWHGLQLAHPVKSVAEQAGLLRQEGANVVILLGQAPRAALVQLAEKVPGIDLVITGHEPGEQPATPVEVARGTWMLNAGQQGQHLGRVTLKMPARDQSCCLVFDDGGNGARVEAERLRKKAAQLDAQAAEFEAKKDAPNAEARRAKANELRAQAESMGKTASSGAQGNHFAWTAIPITSRIATEPGTTAQLKAYKESLSELNARCEANVTCTPAPAGASHYVGTGACVACHDTAVAFWKQATVIDPERAKQYADKPDHPNREGRLGHVRAWKTLVEAKATGNRDCIECHAVGFDQPGGFCRVADGEKWGAVGCESCHGPGSKHVETEEPRDIIRDVKEAHCRHCHVVPHIKSTESFNYREKLKVILGPGHGEKRARELGGVP